MINTRSARRLWALLLFLAVVLAIAIVFIPVFLIQPFKPQTTSQIELSYALRRWSPLLTVLITIVAALIAALMWRGARAWWRKAALAAFVLIAAGTIWASRQNHFEWMFNPLPDPRFSVASEASFRCRLTISSWVSRSMAKEWHIPSASLRITTSFRTQSGGRR